jgi:hypothetical protein
MLTQVVRNSKNFLTSGNLLDRGEVGTTGLWGRSTDVLLLLTPRWSRGSGGVALSWLVTVLSKLPRSPIVEARVACELADTKLPVEVYGSPTTATTKADHTAGLQAKCRPGGTWVEHPQDLERLSFPSSLLLWHGWHPPAVWQQS